MQTFGFPLLQLGLCPDPSIVFRGLKGMSWVRARPLPHSRRRRRHHPSFSSSLRCVMVSSFARSHGCEGRGTLRKSQERNDNFYAAIRPTRLEFPLPSLLPPSLPPSLPLLFGLFGLLGLWVVSKREKVIKRRTASLNFAGGGGGGFRAAHK